MKSLVSNFGKSHLYRLASIALLLGCYFIIAAPSCSKQMTADELRSKYDREDSLSKNDRFAKDTALFTPIEVHKDSVHAISISEIFSEIATGSKVGGHKVGLFREKRLDYQWKYNVFITNKTLIDLTVYTDISELGFPVLSHYILLEDAYATIESHGYPTIGDIEALKSGRSMDKSQYDLQPTIKSAKFNTYSGNGNMVDRGAAEIEVEWKLVDGADDRTVWVHTTSAKTESHDIGVHPLARAFSISLRKALSMDGLVSKLRLDTTVMNARKQRDMVACESGAELSLPKELETVMSSTLLLQVGKSSGSAVIISQDGFALTAAHVVGGWDQVRAITYSGDTLYAHVIRTDFKHDVALLQLPEGSYTCAQLTEDTTFSVGSELWVIGAPLGEQFSFSVSRGIISGVRTIDEKRYIQTDASVNFGNSGGPFIQADGTVVGIVTMKANPIFTEGLSFGVPINVAKKALSLTFISQ